MNDENGKVDHLQELNQKLYNKNQNSIRPRRPGILHPKSYGIENEWTSPIEPMKKKKTFQLPPSVFKKFFVFSIIFFIGALGFAAYILFGGKTSISTDNIEIEILGNAFANGGEAIPLQIEVSNKNSTALELVDLVVEYPKGSESISDVLRIRRSIGTIGSGKSINENVSVVLFGEQGSVKDINAKLEYRIAGSNAIFVKEQKYQVTINQAPLSLAIDAPDDITPGQVITLGITAKLNTVSPAKNLLMRVDYPPGFQFSSAEPMPSFGNNIWALGDLPAGGESKITLRGVISGFDGDERTFHIFTGESSEKIERNIGVIYNSLLHTVVLKKPFLEATLLVNGEQKDSYVVNSGSSMRGEVKYENNLTDKLLDVEIRAKITGEVLDKDSISPIDGFYDSTTNEIIWNKNTSKELASLAPGDSGRLGFTFKSKSLVTSSKGLIQNPEISAEISIKGAQSGENIGAREVDGFEKKTIRINSDLQIFASSLYSVGPFKNTGGIPPHAEKETTYTISWKITNSANRITGAVAKTTLPSYVRFIKASNPAVTYNETSREVKWDLGEIAPGTGLTRENREIFFQVGLNASSSQINTSPELTNTTSLSGLDIFTNINLENRRNPINTRLINDPAFTSGAEKVVR